MAFSPQSSALPTGSLRKVHHIALNVRDINASRHFYGNILGLHELTGDEVPSTFVPSVTAGKLANFITPDGTAINLFWKPELLPPAPDPDQAFTRAHHLAFDIAPELFDQAVAVLCHHQVPINSGPVSRPTGRGIYFYDPDGFIIELRCNLLSA
ncbi:MAG: VOC family protein [Symploca sp. SIO3E6]|nr:VOC family protein [Caldora sp. SIO3E6]